MAAVSKIEYHILDIIDKAGEPMGSGSISIEVSDIKKISEATVGRILRELDRRGYTKKIGFQGRKLTNKGKEELNNYRRKQEKKEQFEQLLNLSQARTKKELINILVARRAIERETARLAALQASKEELTGIKDIIEHNELLLKKGQEGYEDDLKFHKAIAEASHNPVLAAALNMVRDNVKISPVLEYIRKEVSNGVLRDHKRIYQAIASNNPDLAEGLMINHINNVIEDVEKYWQRIEEERV